MRKFSRLAIAALAIAPWIPMALAQGDAPWTMKGDAARGQKLAFDRSMGNCLACHAMKGSDVPSDVGPPLANLKARYPNAKDLYAIVYDEQTRNPLTVMPPFGKNLILTPQQIDDVIAFLYTQ